MAEPRPLCDRREDVRPHDHFWATLQPLRTDDLKPEAQAIVGKRLPWEAMYVNEPDDNYPGDMCCVPLQWGDGEFPGWAPLCDLTDIEISSERIPRQ